MHVSLFSLALLAVACASPISPPKHQNPKPAAFFLAGDSTTAIQSFNGGGWGDGFLTTLVHGAFGTNFGHNGATTVSFVAGGDWATVLDSVKQNKKDYEPYVTIQFGHNDQKVDKNISIAQFETNLKNMVHDVRKAGGTPILVTSLSRRSYNATTNRIILNLAPQVASTLAVAADTRSAFIDLNKASTKYLNEIGQTDAWKYNLLPEDRTHLNFAGSLVFGNMVGDLIKRSKVGKDVRDFLKLDKKIIRAIEKGEFILPATETEIEV